MDLRIIHIHRKPDPMHMKPSSPLLIIGLSTIWIGLLILLSGCEFATTGAKIEARIQEMPEVFAEYPEDIQKTIRWGYVKKGYSKTMAYMALGKPNRVETSKNGARVTWIYYDETVVSQDVAMRSASAESGTAYHTAGVAKPGARPVIPGEVLTARQIAEDSGTRGPDGTGQTYYDERDHSARVLVVFEHGRVTTVQRIESTPRDRTFEDTLRSFNDEEKRLPEGDVRMGEATEVPRD